MKKRGPKPKPNGEVRSLQLPVRVNKAELEKYREQSVREGKDLSTWVRNLLDEKCEKG
jgi:hypothetical protein